MNTSVSSATNQIEFTLLAAKEYKLHQQTSISFAKALKIYSNCRSHRTDSCIGVKGLGHVLSGHVPTWLTRAPGLLISSLRVPDAYGPTSSVPILALFASLFPFLSRVYSTALLP